MAVTLSMTIIPEYWGGIVFCTLILLAGFSAAFAAFVGAWRNI